MVAPTTTRATALLTEDPQLIRRVLARQYRLELYRPAPGEAAAHTFVTTNGHPVGWHRRNRLERLLIARLAQADDHLIVVLTRRSLIILELR